MNSQSNRQNKLNLTQRDVNKKKKTTLRRQEETWIPSGQMQEKDWGTYKIGTKLILNIQ